MVGIKLNKVKSFFNRINYKLVAVLILAMISTYFLSTYIIANFKTEFAAVVESEDNIRDDTNAILVKAEGKTPEQMNVVENFVLAEYYLGKQDNVAKVCSGKITAMGITQGMFAKKYKKGNDYFIEEISSGVVSVAERQFYNVDKAEIDIYSGSNIKDDGSAKWSKEKKETLTYDTFKEKYGINPTDFCYYIVSSKTVTKSGKVETKANGNIVYFVELETNYSTMKYGKKINVTSGATKAPKFDSIKITFEIDSNWNFQQIRYQENYQVAIPALGSMFVATSGDLVENYTYTNVEFPKD